MTKNEIIRELSKCNPSRVRSLFVVYHNPRTDTKYVFSYDWVPFPSLSVRRELAKVVLSVYKLRKYIRLISVRYFSSADGECVDRFYSSDYNVLTISDFIKSIKKINYGKTY